MGPQVWKNIFQVIVFVGSFFVLIGSICVWFWGHKVSNIEKERREILSREKERAISELQAIASKQQSANNFFGFLENRLQSVYLELELKKNVNFNIQKNIELYLTISAFDKHYIIKSLNIQPGVYGFTTKAYSADLFKPSQVPLRERIKDARTTSLILPMVKETNILRFELLRNIEQTPVNVSLRSFQGSSIEFYCSKELVRYISEIKLVANDWLLFNLKSQLENWKKIDPRDWMLIENKSEIYTLLFESNNKSSFIHFFDFQENIPEKIDERKLDNYKNTYFSYFDTRGYRMSQFVSKEFLNIYNRFKEKSAKYNNNKPMEIFFNPLGTAPGYFKKITFPFFQIFKDKNGEKFVWLNLDKRNPFNEEYVSNILNTLYLRTQGYTTLSWKLKKYEKIGQNINILNDDLLILKYMENKFDSQKYFDSHFIIGLKKNDFPEDNVILNTILFTQIRVFSSMKLVYEAENLFKNINESIVKKSDDLRIILNKYYMLSNKPVLPKDFSKLLLEILKYFNLESQFRLENYLENPTSLIDAVVNNGKLIKIES